MSRRRGKVVLATAATVLVVVLLLTVVPVPRAAFRLDDAVIGDLWTRCDSLYATRGTTVSFHWSAQGPTEFGVEGCSPGDPREVYRANGTEGDGSFVSNGQGYKFGSLCPGPPACYPATVTGTRTAPLVSLWNCMAYFDITGRERFIELCLWK